ncbi:MAG: CHASE2 domain-containing protein [Acetobacteraceae bacterium]
MLAVALSVVVLLLAARFLGWLQPVDLAAYDQLVAAWAGQQRTDRIVLVTINEADVRKPDWPLKDRDLAALLERLTGWGARAIGVDIYRDYPRPPGSTELADLLKQHKEIFWVSKLADEAGPGTPPPSAIVGTIQAALADVVVDAGGVVRRGLMAAEDVRSGDILRSLGAAVAEDYTGHKLRSIDDDTAALGNGLIALVHPGMGPYARVNAGGYQTLLDFKGGGHRFRRIRYADVIANDTAADAVRGHIVLIGTEATTVRDSFATPFGTRSGASPLMSGVELHAHLADQLIRIQEGISASRVALPGWADAVLIGSCAIAAAMICLIITSSALILAALLAGATLIAVVTFVLFGQGLILPGASAVIAWTCGAGAAIWVLHGIGRRDRLHLRRSFDHYLDPRIIDELLDDHDLPRFGGESREISALFTDIAGFTTFSESLPPTQVASLLHDYFDGVCREIVACGGLISVFLGDGLLALFGAPHPQPDHPDRAVEAALRIDVFASRFSAEQQASGIPFGVTRVGVHTGVALVGNIGTRARMNYSALGDMINTASRLEGLNKRIGTRIIVSGDTMLRCRRHRFRVAGEFVLKGRRSALLVATPLSADAAHATTQRDYEAAYASLRAGLPSAKTLFHALRRADPADPCIVFHDTRLAKGETGVHFVMDEK